MFSQIEILTFNHHDSISVEMLMLKSADELHWQQSHNICQTVSDIL